MVSTSDFGSENIGSSPVPPTGYFYHINNILCHIPLLGKVGVFFYLEDYDRRKRYNFKATASQDRQQTRACYRQYGRGSTRGIENDFRGTTKNDKRGQDKLSSNVERTRI